MAELPRHLLRSDSVYRTMSAGGEDGLLGAGFSLKAGGDDGRRQGLQHYSLSWCLRGRGLFDDGATRQEVVPGTLFQRFPSRPHRLELDRDGRWAECWLALGPDAYRLLATYRLVDPARPLTTLALDASLIDEVRAERDALRRAAEHELPLHLARIVALVVRLLLGARNQGRDRGTEAVMLACQRLAADPTIPLRAAIRGSGMGYERFRKVFREQTGVAPGVFRIQRRLDRARALLHAGDLSIARIADQLGYASPFAFSSQFKRFVGVAPDHYRRAR